jgi:hypothetical protein
VLDPDWFRQLVHDALRGHVDEEVEDAYYAMRHLGFEDSWRKGFRWIGRRLASGDHPADHTGTFNLLAVTPTRVMVFNAKPKAPFVQIRRQIAEWPRGGVAIASQRATAVAHYNQGASSTSRRILRATFTWDGEERPLILDFPNDEHAKAVLAAAAR